MNRKGTEPKKLGIWMSTSLVAGNMIGSGIFLLPATLAFFGGISLFGWLFSAIGAIFLSLVFSRLSRLIPGAGGPYLYTRTAFGNLSGFMVAWGYWIALWSGNAAIALAAVGYLGIFIPALAEDPIISAMTAIGLIWLFSWINMLGIREAGMVQLVTTLLKLLPLIFIGTLGFHYFRSENFYPLNLTDETNFSAITSTAAITLWAFLGIESATIPSDQVKDPRRTIPKATILGTLLVLIVYIASTGAVMGIIPPSELSISASPFAAAAKEIWGTWAGYAVAAGALVACLGALNGWILLQGQFPLAVSRDNLFPLLFSRLSRKGIPGLGIAVSSLLASILIIMNYTRGLVSMFTFIIMLATLSTLIPYVFSSLADILFCKRDQYRQRNKTVILRLAVSVPALAFSLWAIWGLGLITVLWGVVLLVLGVPVFFYLRRRKDYVKR